MKAILSSSVASLGPQPVAIPGGCSRRPGDLQYIGVPKEARAARIEQLRALPQVEMPLTHRFQDGVYIREILMPTDTWVVGHVHKTRHWNIVISGRAMVSINGGEAKLVEAPAVFESEPGAQKWLYIIEEMRFLTIHQNPTNERDIATLERDLITVPADLLEDKGAMTVDQFRMSVNKTLNY